MRRNPYLRVLLMLSMIQAQCTITFAQIKPSEKQDVITSQKGQTSSSTTESTATQFNIRGRNRNDNLRYDVYSEEDYDDGNGNISSNPSLSQSKDADVHLADASSLMPSNHSSAKQPFKKPKVVLTLNLRSKDDATGEKKSTKSKSPFLFGNNVIRFDTRTNRLIIPTTSSSLKFEDGAEDVDYDDLDETTLISVITEGPLVEVQNQTMRALKILDKLRSLTNSKQKGGNKKEATYGFKKYDTLHPKLRSKVESSGKGNDNQNDKHDSDAQASTQVLTTSTEPGKHDKTEEYTTLTSKVGGHINQNTPVSPEPLIQLQQHPSHTTHPPHYSSTTPIVLKVGKNAVNSLFQNYTMASSSVPPIYLPAPRQPDIPQGPEHINTGETRVAVTADQVGGNRPTQRPFHYAPTTEPPPTTTTEIKVKNSYAKQNSPHNFDYAPTHDPTSIVHNEDLSVEDFQDFRIANLVFGSKVGADPASVPRPPPNARKTIRDYEVYDEYQGPALPVRLLQENVKRKPQVIIKTTTTIPTTTTKPPVFVPERTRSGVDIKTPSPQHTQAPQSQASKNSHLLSQNDNLPFYKEPGGVFKEHQNPTRYNPDGDDDNYIAHNSYENRPGIKYAPKGPSTQAQPQTVYPNRQRTESPYDHDDNGRGSYRQDHNTPQYIPSTQQTPYIQQQAVVHHPRQPQLAAYPSPPPQGHPHQALHQRPHQQPIYYHQQPVAGPAPYYPIVPTQNRQPAYHSQGPAVGFVPILRPQGQGYHQPGQGPPVHNQYREQNRFNSPERSGHFPHRNDPNSDNFFGDPAPDTEQASKNSHPPDSSRSNSKRKQNSRPPKSNNDYDDRSYENPRPPSRPPPPPPTPPRRHEPRPSRPDEDSRGNPRYNEDRAGPDRQYDNHPENRRNNYNNGDRHRNDVSGESRHRNNDEGDSRHGNNDNYSSERPRHNGYETGRPRNENRRGTSRGDGFEEDYVPPEGVGEYGEEDYVEPNYNNQRPVYDDAPGRNRANRGGEGGGVERDPNFQDDKPFRPSPADFGPIRPSNQHPGYTPPKFDHPNIQYPQGQPQRQSYPEGPEYDPKGFGVGHGPAPNNNIQLDPIYTRTIKQFDEERRNAEQRERDSKPARHNSHRPSGQDVDDEHHGENPRRPPPDEDEEHRQQALREDDEHRRQALRDDEHRRPPPRDEDEHRRPPQRDDDEDRRPPPRDEEDHDDRREPPPRENDDEEERRPPPRRNDEEEEEEEEAPQRNQQRKDDDEEEEEEESKSAPAKTKKDDEEEEEEEEEEDEEQEKPPRNRQRNPQRSTKSKPQKKSRPPPNEKSGDLEDDISAIDREFGGIFGSSGKQPIVVNTPVPANPGISLPNANYDPNIALSPSTPEKPKSTFPIQLPLEHLLPKNNSRSSNESRGGGSFIPTHVIVDV